jgi:DNA-binding PucR family transcriptional regulator
MTGAIVADPHAPGRRARLAEALSGLGAVVSVAVPPGELPRTVEVATTAARLRREGVVVGDPLFVADHFDALVVHSDPRLLALLTEQVLQPLEAVPPGTRARLEETLTAWLSAMGDRQTVARTLHVHPQTVRYRMGRLRQLFGPTLDDPSTRLRLTLALCWRAPTSALPGDDRA